MPVMHLCHEPRSQSGSLAVPVPLARPKGRFAQIPARSHAVGADQRAHPVGDRRGGGAEGQLAPPPDYFGSLTGSPLSAPAPSASSASAPSAPVSLSAVSVRSPRMPFSPVAGSGP